MAEDELKIGDVVSCCDEGDFTVWAIRDEWAWGKLTEWDDPVTVALVDLTPKQAPAPAITFTMAPAGGLVRSLT